MQKEFFHARSRNEIIDTIMLLQHPPVYTLGRRSQPEQPILKDSGYVIPAQAGIQSDGMILDSCLHRNDGQLGAFSGETHRSRWPTKEDENNPPIPPLEKGDKGGFERPFSDEKNSDEKNRERIYIYRVDRGGGATYHGPGQLVGYPIIGLKSYTSDFHAYLRMLEDVMIGTLKDFSITSQRLKGYTGVWVEGEKIGSIGVRIVKGITMHGFALNVNNDLEPFNKILPCNIKGVKMTSMSRILRTTLNIPVVEESLIRNFALIFGVCFEKKCNPPYRFK